MKRKKEIFDYYQNALEDLPGIEFMPEASYGKSNRWLTVILITQDEFGASPEEVMVALEAENIEARPVWKPMHMQPVFNPQIASRKGAKAQNNIEKKTYPCRVVGGEVAKDLFERGLCLPSGTAMTDGDLERVVEVILNCRFRKA